MKPFQDVGKAITQPLGLKISKSGQTLIGGVLITVGAWWIASKMNLLPSNMHIQRFIPLP